MPEVCKMTGRKPRTIYRMVEAGTFPKQHRQSHRVAVWYESEVQAWQVDQMVADLLA